MYLQLKDHACMHDPSAASSSMLIMWPLTNGILKSRNVHLVCIIYVVIAHLLLSWFNNWNGNEELQQMGSIFMVSLSTPQNSVSSSSSPPLNVQCTTWKVATHSRWLCPHTVAYFILKWCNRAGEWPYWLHHPWVLWLNSVPLYHLWSKYYITLGLGQSLEALFCFLLKLRHFF